MVYIAFSFDARTTRFVSSMTGATPVRSSRLMKHIIGPVAEIFSLISGKPSSISSPIRRATLNYRAFALSLLTLTAALSARGQIINGSFESPVVSTLNVAGLGVAPGVAVYTSIINPTAMTGWTVLSGDVTQVNGNAALTSSLGLFTAAAGNQYVVLNGLAENVNLSPLSISIAQTGTIGDISQTFSTVAGKGYQISFQYQGLAVGLLTNNPTIDVGLTNANSSTAPINGTLTANISLGAWQTETFTFVATGSSSTLSFFQDSSGANVGLIGLDNVVLTALPEPWQYGDAAVVFLTLLIAGRVWSQKKMAAAVLSPTLRGAR